MQLKDQSLFRQQCYIDGAWTGSTTGRTFEVNNPADGSILGTVPELTAEETRNAINAAEAAFLEWGRKPAKERASVLRAWLDLIREHTEDIELRFRGHSSGWGRLMVDWQMGFFYWGSQGGDPNPGTANSGGRHLRSGGGPSNDAWGFENLSFADGHVQSASMEAIVKASRPGTRFYSYPFQTNIIVSGIPARRPRNAEFWAVPWW